MDKYRVDSKIGAGSYGQVYKVTRLIDNVEYAMKRFKVDDSMVLSPSVLRELSALKTLEHPYIVELVEVFIHHSNDGEYLVVILELGDTDIELYITESIPDRHTGMTRFMMILSALTYMHSIGLIHGDLSPSNIIIVKNVVKLIDFGFSRRTHRRFNPALPPTINVRPIDIMLNRPTNVLTIDTWSLATIYYILTTHENLIDINSNNVEEYMVEINKKFGNLSSKIHDKIIKRMFQFDTKRRPTIAEIYSLLKPDMLDRHILMKEPSIRYIIFPSVPKEIKMEVIYFIMDIVLQNNLSFEIAVVTFENIMRLYSKNLLNEEYYGDPIRPIRVVVFVIIWMVSKVVSDRSWTLDDVYRFYVNNGINIDKTEISVIHNKLLVDLDWNVDPDTMYSDSMSFNEWNIKYFNVLTLVFMISDFYETTSIGNKTLVSEMIITDFLRLKKTRHIVSDMVTICSNIKTAINTPIVRQYAQIVDASAILEYLQEIRKN
jgi:serine/threonine protein kinase